MVELNVSEEVEVAKTLVREREKSAVSTNGEQSLGNRWRLHMRCVKSHNVVCCVSVGDVRYLFDLSEDKVVPKMRKWSGVWEEGRRRGAEEGGRGRNLEMIRDEENDFAGVNPTGDEE